MQKMVAHLPEESLDDDERFCSEPEPDVGQGYGRDEDNEGN